MGHAGWLPHDVSYFNSMQGMLAAFSFRQIVPRMLRRHGACGAFRMGSLFSAASLALLSQAWRGPSKAWKTRLILMCFVVLTPGRGSPLALRTITTKQGIYAAKTVGGGAVGRGELSAALSSLQSIVQVAGPLLWGGAFRFFQVRVMMTRRGRSRRAPLHPPPPRRARRAVMCMWFALVDTHACACACLCAFWILPVTSARGAGHGVVPAGRRLFRGGVRAPRRASAVRPGDAARPRPGADARGGGEGGAAAAGLTPRAGQARRSPAGGLPSTHVPFQISGADGRRLPLPAAGVGEGGERHLDAVVLVVH